MLRQTGNPGWERLGCGFFARASVLALGTVFL
jgi:hypothetical protein